MNTLIKTTIGVIALTLGSASVAQASKNRGYDDDTPRHEQSSRNDKKGHKKHATRNDKNGHNKRSVKHVVRYESYNPYYVSDRHVSALMGGLIGSAIGNEMGRGDPAATVSGALLGAVLGSNLSR